MNEYSLLITCVGHKNKQIISSILYLFLTENASETWIGLSSNRIPVSFAWSSGSSVIFTNWYPLEPRILPNRRQLCVSAEQSVSWFIWSMVRFVALVLRPTYSRDLYHGWDQDRQFLLFVGLPSLLQCPWQQGRSLLWGKKLGLEESFRQERGGKPRWTYGV